MTLHGADGNLQSIGDLLDRKAAAVEELHDLSLTRVQTAKRPGDRGLRQRPTFLSFERRIRFAFGLTIRHGLRIGHRPELLNVIDPETTSDREQPGAETKTFVEPIQMPQDPDECVLSDVLREIFTPSQSKEKMVQGSTVSAHQRCHCFAITSLRSSNQLQFLGPFHVQSLCDQP